ncbi:PfkB family carbohydrate kinase [Variovorax sp. PCZ-1]|uniref:carbohydrate kinase family protein n=1 Tax=Variovorax sp. PCZ-1 TaxID=2835533 RepID=UPI001BCF98E8|nr:PfkB family carbohydrate kinase [Variovorax sp. PCZ-1]MBS7806107.1 carbohydrate kinase [Variovorax sp. PCZ-1]
MIACYGEALVDLFVSPYSRDSLRTDSQACLGGSVFNFCLAAQRQGMNSLYLNALSTDSFGRQFAHLLQTEGVLIDAEACPEPTSIAVIQLDTQGKATYAFHRIGIADTARSAAKIIANWRSEVTSLHTGCLMLMPDTWLQTQQIVAHATQGGCVVSVDANLRPAVVADHPAYVACVQAACAAAHVVKVSDDDLVTLGMLAPADMSDMHAVVRAAREMLSDASTTRLVALTLGERGAWLLTQEHSVFEAAPSGVIVKDTVGAGDSFAAALLAHLQSQEMLTVARLEQGLAVEVLHAALLHAVAAAALCVQRTGCDPATWKETADFVRRQQ